MTPAHNLRDKLRRGFMAILLSVLAVAVLTFGVDFLIFRIRVATNHDAYGSVTVNHYYAVLQKNGKTQFIFDPPQQELCVHALYPHADALPCWYLIRHTDPRTDI